MSATPNFLDMPDEEFSKLQGPDAVTVATVEETTVPEETTEPEKKEVEETVTPAASETGAETETEAKTEEPVTPADSKPETTAAVPPAAATASTPFKEGVEKKDPPKPEDKKQTEQPAAAASTSTSQDLDYKAFYERVMAPFKANGKTIQLTSPEEVIQLLQMGANYTKKMQAIQPRQKLLMMLENNGLLNENELSFLIDLHKKNPEAIKKLLKDANIDPVDVDTTKVNYQGGTHAVSDQEAALHSAIDDLQGQEGGAKTLQSVQGWDQASKKVLWDNPEILSVIHTQRINGIYDRITAEMDRRKTLGQLPHNTPFLSAYKTVGDELAARGAFRDVIPTSAGTPGTKPVAGTPAAAPVAVRPVKTPATKAAVDPRVKAAAPTRATPRTAQTQVNYLAMSDEDFLKLPHDKL